MSPCLCAVVRHCWTGGPSLISEPLIQPAIKNPNSLMSSNWMDGNYKASGWKSEHEAGTLIGFSALNGIVAPLSSMAD